MEVSQTLYDVYQKLKQGTEDALENLADGVDEGWNQIRAHVNEVSSTH